MVCLLLYIVLLYFVDVLGLFWNFLCYCRELIVMEFLLLGHVLPYLMTSWSDTNVLSATFSSVSLPMKKDLTLSN